MDATDNSVIFALEKLDFWTTTKFLVFPQMPNSFLNILIPNGTNHEVVLLEVLPQVAIETCSLNCSKTWSKYVSNRARINDICNFILSI